MNNSYSLGQADPTGTDQTQLVTFQEGLDKIQSMVMWSVIGLVAVAAILIFRK